MSYSPPRHHKECRSQLGYAWYRALSAEDREQVAVERALKAERKIAYLRHRLAHPTSTVKLKQFRRISDRRWLIVPEQYLR